MIFSQLRILKLATGVALLNLVISNLALVHAMPTATMPVHRALGPGVGGCCYALAIHPQNPRIMLVGVDMGAMFRTADGGKTWQMLGSFGVNPGYRCSYRAAFCPRQPNTAWVVSEHGAYKSLDCGKTWRRMTASISGRSKHWGGIAFDPDNNDIVYLFQGKLPSFSCGSWSYAQIYRSHDGGKSWQKLTSPIAGKGYSGFCSLFIDPNSPLNSRQLIISGQSGLFRSRDGGKSWHSIAHKLPLPRGKAPYFGILTSLTSADKTTVLTLTVEPQMTSDGKVSGGVFQSRDGGNSWVARNCGLEKTIAQLARWNKNTRRHHTFIARFSASSQGRIGYAGCRLNIFRSDDGGLHWRRVSFPGSWSKNIRHADGTQQCLLLNNGRGNFQHSYCYQIDSFNDLAVSPSQPDVAVFTDNEGATATFDGGKTWQDLAFDYTTAFAPGLFGKILPVRYTHRIKSRGMNLLVCNAMRRDLFDSRIIYAAYMDLGFRVSRDGGESWETPLKGLKTRMETGGWGWCRSITLDPQVKGRLYATFGSDRVHISEDYGRTWQEIGPRQAVRSNLDKSAHSGIVIDLNTPPQRRTLYAGLNTGVYRTEDGGRTWQKISKGLEGGERIHILKKIGSTLWAASYPRDQKLKKPGLFRSDDSGRTWQRVNSAQFSYVSGLDFCSAHPEHIYVVALAEPQYWSEAAIFRSRDGGKSWTKICGGKLYRHIAVHPRDPNRIYSAYMSADLNRAKPAYVVSADGGQSWRDISGDNPISGYLMNLLIDPMEPQRIYYHDLFTVYEVFDPPRQSAKHQ